MRAKRCLILCAIVLGALSGRSVFAQDITGTWQGTRKGAEDARLVIKISRLDGGLRAVVYDIDPSQSDSQANFYISCQRKVSACGARAESISFDGSTVFMSIPELGSTYKGALNSEGKSISGTWTSSKSSALKLVRPINDPSWTRFDVASIKPNHSDSRPLTNAVNCLPGGRFTANNVTLMQMIVSVYPPPIRRIQMQGGPDWIDKERFDIVATPDNTGGEVNPGQCLLMIQSLLEERFKLSFHAETKEMSVYALVIGKNPPKLQPPKEGEETDFVPGPRGQINLKRVSIVGLVNTMSNILQIPVVDGTGIKGFYDFTLNPAQFATTGTVNSPLPPMLYGDLVVTAVQDELGFKLEKRKMPLEITIIDHAERPTEN